MTGLGQGSYGCDQYGHWPLEKAEFQMVQYLQIQGRQNVQCILKAKKKCEDGHDNRIIKDMQDI